MLLGSIVQSGGRGSTNFTPSLFNGKRRPPALVARLQKLQKCFRDHEASEMRDGVPVHFLFSPQRDRALGGTHNTAPVEGKDKTVKALNKKFPL